MNLARTPLSRTIELIRHHMEEPSYTGPASAETPIDGKTVLADELGFDSLDLIEITMSIEEEFDVELCDDALDAKTVDQLVAQIERHCRKAA